MAVSEELARLAALRDQGVLTEQEFEAQKAAVLRGESTSGATPAQAAVPEKKKKALGIGCLVLIGILVALFVIAGMSGSSDTATEEKAAAEAATPPVEVTAGELFNAYQANEAGAQQQYGDRPLLVSGTIDRIDLDMMDNPVVHLRTSNQFMSAAANLTEASQAKAGDLAKGQKVVVLCAGVSEVIGMPQLKDCEIQ